MNGKKHWMWTWQNQNHIYIALAPTRGYKGITDNYPDGLIQATLTSECLAAQLKTKAKTHQLCIAHLRRELQYFIQLAKESWSTSFMQLIQEALCLKAKIQSHPFEDFTKEIMEILATRSYLPKGENLPTKTICFHKILEKYDKFLDISIPCVQILSLSLPLIISNLNLKTLFMQPV